MTVEKIQPYSVKLIKSGDNLEWHEYEFPVRRCNSNESRKTKKTDIEVYTRKNLHKSRKELIRLIENNPDLNKMLTLTFADETKTNPTETNKLFQLFVKRLYYKYENFAYICVPELQLKRAKKYNIKPPIHYHVLHNLHYIDKKILQRIWSHGIVDIRRIDNVKSRSLYISKYVTKEMITKFYKKKKYFYSTNVKPPTVLFDDFALKYYLSLNLHLEYEKKFMRPYGGIYQYKFYKILGKKNNNKAVNMCAMFIFIVTSLCTY